MNRTFDYQWNRYDVDTVETGVIGANAYSRAGAAPASEPEVQAIQNFLLNNEIDALASLHTGIQSVLYPWCYRAYDASQDSESILYMKEVAQKMADGIEGRDFGIRLIDFAELTFQFSVGIAHAPVDGDLCFGGRDGKERQCCEENGQQFFHGEHLQI